MGDSRATLPTALERAYHQTPNEVDLTRFIAFHDIPDDQVLAEVIEADGRIRIAMGKTVQLERYLEAVPNLSERPDSLDAAIDVALRARSCGGHPTAEAVEELVGRYPDLEAAIREAAELSNVLVSTDGLQARLRKTQVRDLPDDFGPELSDGRARYELRKLLGEGAFGQVYLAVDRHLSEPGHPATVAIKILMSRDGASSVQRDRLIDEATTARRVDHPNVVRVMDRGVSGSGEDYIVYEYVDGGDLAIALSERRERTPLREAASMVARIARGVQAAHSAGLVHCDLKPGNIMLTSEGEPKVADFGIAARLDDDSVWPGDTYDLATMPLGNLAFIAPEQFRKEPGAANIPADLYALGGILFLLVTGQLPNGNTIEAIAATHDPESGRGEAPSMSAMRPNVDRDLDMIGRRALAPDPSDRYASAAALADDLESWMRHEPISWTRPSPWRLLKLWAIRKPGLAVASVLLLGTLVAAQYFWFENQRTAAEKKITELELEKEKEIDRRVRATLTTALGRIQGAIKDGARHESEILTAIWALETGVGPEVLDDEMMGGLWDTRIEVYRPRVDQALEEGRGDELNTLVREAQLAFWLISPEGADEALQRLERNRAAWSKLLAPSDPWLTALDVMSECAAAHRSIEAGNIEDVREAAGRLEARREFLTEQANDAPVHHLALRTLRSLYAGGVLNDVAARGDVESELRQLLDLKPDDPL